jgi:hypothetical protein
MAVDRRALLPDFERVAAQYPVFPAALAVGIGALRHRQAANRFPPTPDADVLNSTHRIPRNA